MKKWVCPVCGYVHEGEEPPEKCPVCKVPGSKFTARAKVVSRTRRTGVFDVNVYDDQDRLLTHSILTGFITETPLFDD